MDSNNYLNPVGVGEREGRVYSDLVRKRHYNFSHGVGRSGNLVDAQPKAAGSTVMSNLANALTLDLIRDMGIKSCSKAVIVPLATGMTIMMTLLAMKQERPEAKYVLWSRIDQSSCFKSILGSGLVPVIIDTIAVEECNDKMRGTDVSGFRSKIEELGAANVCSIISTTSCFAPRTCDNIVELAEVCSLYQIPHLVNNAYGLQSTYLTHHLETAFRRGRVDVFIQSTDKNFMVPVGGAILAQFELGSIIDRVTALYPGRASSSQHLDMLITLLSFGRQGFKSMTVKRKENHQYLREKLSKVAQSFGEKVITGKNPISMALTLKNFPTNVEMIGSMLHTRGVSGCRVISVRDSKRIENHEFKAWGSHCSDPSDVPYLTVSASLGIESDEIETFIDKLEKVLKERRQFETTNK
ncbi:O-phosphoseryl-tRNA(Sec) selenium transferase isoform X2 [Uranotaenia lowii]|nr:O-phosphoseryl-tRNA(Sec) selenium transferase isoform X2 [Uranotaenia lowii]